MCNRCEETEAAAQLSRVRSEGSGMRVLGEGEGVVLLAVVLPWSAFVEKGSVSFYRYVLAPPDVSGPPLI